MSMSNVQALYNKSHYTDGLVLWYLTFPVFNTQLGYTIRQNITVLLPHLSALLAFSLLHLFSTGILFTCRTKFLTFSFFSCSITFYIYIFMYLVFLWIFCFVYESILKQWKLIEVSSSSCIDITEFLTLSCHQSLWSITPGMSSRLHSVSTLNWCKYLLVDQHWRIYEKTLLMSSPLLFQQCPTCLVWEMGDRWPYSCCFVWFLPGFVQLKLNSWSINQNNVCF